MEPMLHESYELSIIMIYESLEYSLMLRLCQLLPADQSDVREKILSRRFDMLLITELILST